MLVGGNGGRDGYEGQATLKICIEGRSGGVGSGQKRWKAVQPVPREQVLIGDRAPAGGQIRGRE